MRSAAFAVDSILCVFGVQDQCKNDQNQFKFNWNSNKMRSAAFAGKQNLVFLTFFGVQGLDKAFPFKWNTRVFNVFRRPGSMQNWLKSIQINALSSLRSWSHLPVSGSQDQWKYLQNHDLGPLCAAVFSCLNCYKVIIFGTSYTYFLAPQVLIPISRRNTKLTLN